MSDYTTYDVNVDVTVTVAADTKEEAEELARERTLGRIKEDSEKIKRFDVIRTCGGV